MPEPAQAVFLSYASQDAEIARRICEALRADGVEVWFDAAGGLEHGDEWDSKIRRQIKECVLFLPVISASTQARLEGYFRIEWELAAERAMGFAHNVPFILPIVVDATGEAEALVPERFRRVQWMRLPGGLVPADVRARLLKLWAERTAAGRPVVSSHPVREALAVASLPPPPAADDKSIAVLPFANMSADAENEYFSDGMTEEIINALVQVPDLRVAARTSVFAFKGKPDDLRTIAGKLNVRTVLEGSVRKAGNKIRITAQLINAADGFHLWAEKFDRGLDDIFAVQDEIARTIAERLKAKLAGGARKPLVVAPTADIEAYQLYLQGRFFWNQRGGGLMKGLKCFEAALAKDPNYAAAHGGVADAYVLMAFYGYVRAKEVVPLARSAAQRALELEPEMPEAQSALAFVTGVFDLQVDASYRAYRRVVESHPKFVPARYWRASTESICGRHHEGVRLAEEAVRLEPHSLIANALFAWVSITARTGRSVELARHVLAMEPNFLIGRWILGIALLAENQFDESIAELRQAVEISQQLPWMVGTYGCALAYAGRTAEARLVLEQLSQRARTGYVPAYALFLLHAYLREERTALDLLEQAIADGDAGICYFGIVVAWPTPMGLPEQYMNRDTRAAYAQRLGLQLV